MVKIAESIDTAFPQLAGKQKRPFKPHMTVGQWQADQLDAQIENLDHSWTPIEWTVSYDINFELIRG